MHLSVASTQIELDMVAENRTSLSVRIPKASISRLELDGIGGVAMTIEPLLGR